MSDFRIGELRARYSVDSTYRVFILLYALRGWLIKYGKYFTLFELLGWTDRRFIEPFVASSAFELIKPTIDTYGKKIGLLSTYVADSLGVDLTWVNEDSASLTIVDNKVHLRVPRTIYSDDLYATLYLAAFYRAEYVRSNGETLLPYADIPLRSVDNFYYRLVKHTYKYLGIKP